MADYRASDVELIEMSVGDVRTLESLRQAVVPPYVMIVPFLDLPPNVELVRQDNLEGEGVHGCTFTLRAAASGEGTLRVGFRDLQEDKVVLSKNIQVKIA